MLNLSSYWLRCVTFNYNTICCNIFILALLLCLFYPINKSFIWSTSIAVCQYCGETLTFFNSYTSLYCTNLRTSSLIDFFLFRVYLRGINQLILHISACYSRQINYFKHYCILRFFRNNLVVYRVAKTTFSLVWVAVV